MEALSLLKILLGEDNVKLYVDEDGMYYLIGISEKNCKEKMKTLNLIYDLIYKYTDHSIVTVYLYSKEEFINFLNKNLKLKEIMI